MATPNQLDPRTATLAACLSQPRLGPYLAATSNNVKDAIRLYQWNIDLSGAAYEALHVLEVVLRNAMDAQISLWNAAQINATTGRNHSSEWLMDPSHLLVRLAGADIAKATKRARAALQSDRPGGRLPGHPDILAQLTFGTWRFLLPSRDPGRQLLWTQALSRAFPHLTANPNQLVRQVDGIHRLRNRVAHLEPLLRTGSIEKELKGIGSVLHAIEPMTATWFTSRQRVTTVLKSRPR